MNSKNIRLMAGVIILLSFTLFMGTTDEETKCWNLCAEEFLETGLGFIEIWNDSSYNIGVLFIYDNGAVDSYMVTKDPPNMMRKGFDNGRIKASIYWILPSDGAWKFYKSYYYNIKTGDTKIIRVK